MGANAGDTHVPVSSSPIENPCSVPSRAHRALQSQHSSRAGAVGTPRSAPASPRAALCVYVLPSFNYN